MLHDGRRIAAVDHGKGVRPAAVADQQRIALRVVAGVLRVLGHADQSPVGVLAAARRDAFRDDAAARVAADVDHLRTRVGLLEVIGHGHRVELAHGVVAREDAARVLPRDGRAGLDLRPRQARVLAANAALGDEVVDAAAPLAVARIPVLHGRILHLGVAFDDDLDHGRVQLVLVALRRGASLQIAHVGTFVGHDERPLELPRTGGVDAEIGRKLHRAAHALRDVAERPVGEDRRIERRIEIVGRGNHAPQVLPHQLGAVAQRLGNRAEDDAFLGQCLLEGGLHRNGVHHGIDRHARKGHLLLERNAQLVERAPQFGIDLVHRPELLPGLGGRIIDDVLEVDLRNRQVRPRRRLQRQPVAVGRHTALGHPLRFALLGRNQAHDLFGQSLADGLGLDVRRKSVFIFLLPNAFEKLLFVRCHYMPNIGQRYEIKLQNHNAAKQICSRNPDSAGKNPGPAGSFRPFRSRRKSGNRKFCPQFFVVPQKDSIFAHPFGRNPLPGSVPGEMGEWLKPPVC